MDYFERFQHALFSLPRIQKKALMLLTDAIVLPWILLAAYATRMGFINPVEAFGNLPSSLFVVAPLVTLGVLTIFGAYRSMVRYQGIYSAAVSAIAMLVARSEEHTSELQSRGHLVCRLLLEKKKLSDC